MIDAIVRRIREGAQTDALWDQYIGGWLWWRTYAAGAIAVIPICVGWVALSHVPPLIAVAFTAMVSMIVYGTDWGVYPRPGRGE